VMGKPVEVILGPKTGLPIPANAEIAFEGSIAPDDLIQEGPFGEWTGYFAGGLKQEPVIRIDTMMHRNDPILLGAVPAVPPNDDTFYRGAFRCAAVWKQLEAAGVLGIRGVWAHEAGGSRMWLTVSIKQMFPGHAKQAGLIASQCHAGSYANKYVVVVDEDIDPANMNDVVWAMCTRVDAREDVEILRTSRSGPLDPTSYPEGIFAFNSRMVIDACRPWARREDFPKVSRSSKELDERIKAKWAHVLPR
jgi:UbiD family decarboxylase